MGKGKSARNGRRVGALFVLLLAVLPLTTGPALAVSQDETATYASIPTTYSVTFRVFAHREGLVGHTTANGHVIQENDHFVALPCSCALSSNDGHEFQVKIEYNGRTAIAPVWDVGPWNVDDNYWDLPEQRKWSGIPQGVPQAAAAFTNGYNGGLDGSGRKVQSPAGIDIGDGTFYDLGMTASDWVNVTFLWTHQSIEQLPPLPAGYEDIPTIFFGQRPPLDRAAAKDGYTYFSETGHNVPGPILEYWHRLGWRNLGLPITEFFREVQSDGRIRFIQYFERSILQYVPPEDGGPAMYSDLVGYGAAAPPSARAPVAPFEDSNDHWFFPQTQHSLNHGFKHEWVKHGGLAAFGYPITEEFSGVTADGRPYVAQIFERARFEWWPDKVETGEEITHGLLVVELMRQAGWMK